MVHTTFLTVDYLKEITPISLAVDVNTLMPFVSVGETLHVYDILGTALKDSLLTMIENHTLSGNSEILVEDYIIPCAAWFSFFEASVFIIYRSENKGITKKFSDNSQALDKDEFAIYRQAILDKAQFYRTRLVDYLENNQTLFPLWRCSSTNPINASKGNGSGFYLG